MKDLKVYVNEFMKYKLSEGRDAEKTIGRYIVYIKEAFEYLNINTLDDLNNIKYPTIKMNWVNKKIEEGLSNASMNLRITSVQSFMRFMNDMDYTNNTAFDKIKKLKAKAKKIEVNEDKIIKMLKLIDEDYMKNPSFKTCRDRYMLYMLIFCGLRNGEIRSLKLDSIKLDGSFEVTGKYSKTREVSLPSKLIKMHQNYMSWRGTVKGNSDCLFVSNHGNQLDQNVCNRLVKKYSEMVGLECWTAHSTRKACVTTLINSGVAVEEVAAVVGHVDYKTTLKSYYQQDKKVVKEDIDKNKLLEII